MSPIGGTVNLGITVIRSRHSVRKYKDTPIEDKIVKDALECARLAPTARNEQPWLFGTIAYFVFIFPILGIDPAVVIVDGFANMLQMIQGLF